MAHEHSVFDTDPQFVVDAVTMRITCDSEVKSLRRGDVAAEEYSFRMPRHIDGHDMSLCNKVEVHYNNLHYDKDTRETTMNSSFDEVGNFGVAEDSDEYVVWAWRVGGDATQLSGSLNFCIRFACMNGAEIEYQKFTEIYESIPVGDTIYNTDAVAYDSKDVLEAWRQELLEAIEHGGAVKTVNGASPDENGNVEIEIPEGFSGSWNDLTDKPFGETTAMGDTLTWDGNTEGLESVDIGEGLMVYRVCDNPPVLADFASGCSVTADPDYVVEFDYAIIAQHVQRSGFFLGEVFLFVPQTISNEGIVLEKGIYFFVGTNSLTIPGYNGFETTTIKPIETKYLPDALQFGTETKMAEGDTLYWDGNTEGLVSVDAFAEMIGTLYKISDAVPTLEDCISGATYTFEYDGEQKTWKVGPDEIAEMSAFWGCLCIGDSEVLVAPENNFQIEVEGVTAIFPEAGLYTAIGGDNLFTSLTIPGYTGFVSEQTVVTPMDEKYMPTLTSPNGTKYKLIVADDGTLSAVKA